MSPWLNRISTKHAQVSYLKNHADYLFLILGWSWENSELNYELIVNDCKT